MKVRELGDRVPQRLINRAGSFTAVYMSYWDIKVRRCERAGEHLTAVAEDKHKIRTIGMPRCR
jgi:hypothetical protein